jgi:hypothetical protein
LAGVLSRNKGRHSSWCSCMDTYEVDCRSVLPELSQFPPWPDVDLIGFAKSIGATVRRLLFRNPSADFTSVSSVVSLHGAPTMVADTSRAVYALQNDYDISSESIQSAPIYASAYQLLQHIRGINKSN